MPRKPQAHSVDLYTGRQIIAEGTPDSLANPQYAGTPFTDFAGVSPETDLESLNLNWRERDLPERMRTKDVHRLHPYLAKYIPQLVEIFLRKYRPRFVIDPFVGSGTTLVEAARFGVNSFGVDVSPFNCLLTKVKTDVYNLTKLEEEVFDILRRSGAGERTLFSPRPSHCHNLEPTDYLSSWFAPQALDELLTYCSLIPEYDYGDVLKIILSRSARSARLVPHHELDHPQAPQVDAYWCRKHRRICSPVQEARKFLERYSEDTVRRIRRFAAVRQPAHTTVVCADSRDTEFPPSELVMTSPPYVGLIDYHEQHRYAYELLSLLPEPFASVGYEDARPLDNAVREIGPARDGAGAEARRKYQEAVAAALDRTIERMLPGGAVVVVVNDKHGLFDAIGDALPVEAVCTLNRHVNRRTGRRSGAFYEQIMVWRKTS